MSIRGLSENTKKSYIQSVNGLVQHYRRSPDTINSKEVQDYLLFLHQQRGLAWSTCNTTLQGIRFFFRITLNRPELYARWQKALQAAADSQLRTDPESV